MDNMIEDLMFNCFINGIVGFVETISTGIVTMLLWGWFVVPLGVPAIGVFAACGIALLVSLLTTPVGPTIMANEWAKETVDNQGANMINTLISVKILYPWVILFVGFIIHLLG